MFYNVTGGYVEGIVRGYRNTLLTGQNYGNLTQCETIDGMSGRVGERTRRNRCEWETQEIGR